MADIGTSVGLQGRYQLRDFERPAPPRESTLPDFAKDVMKMEQDQMEFEEQKKMAKEQEFNSQLKPFISVNPNLYLPERIPEIVDATAGLLQTATDAKSRTNNILLDTEFIQKQKDLLALQKKYRDENDLATQIAGLSADKQGEYDPEFIQFASKAVEGKAALDDKNYISLERANKARTFSKYANPALRSRFYEFNTPGANDDVIIDIPDGKGGVIRKTTKGSKIYETQEGRNSQLQKFKDMAVENADPFVMRTTYEVENELNKMMERDEAFKQKFLGMEAAAAQDFKTNMVANKMLEEAMASNELKTGRTLRKDNRFGISFDAGGGAVQTPNGTFVVNEFEGYTGEEAKQQWKDTEEARLKEFFNKNKDVINQSRPDGKKFISYNDPEFKSYYQQILAKQSQADPNKTVGEIKEEEFIANLNKGFSGGTTKKVTFSPKNDTPFPALTENKLKMEVIPTAFYVNDDGKILRIEGYNKNDATKKEKKDLTTYFISPDGNNINNFITTYPSAVEAVKQSTGIDLNLDGVMYTAGKQKQGVVNVGKKGAEQKGGAKAAAPKGETKNVLDKIKAKSTKPIAEYQVNKKGTKAKVKYSDGTEKVIDL